MGLDGGSKFKTVPKAAPAVTTEDESIKQAAGDERRRLAAMQSRGKTVTSNRNAAGLKTVLGV
jgi:hypothetical protein